MLGDLDAAGRDSDGDGGGDIETVFTVTACAAYVYCIRILRGKALPFSEFCGRRDDFDDGFAPLGKGDEKRREGAVGNFSIKDRGKRIGGGVRG